MVTSDQINVAVADARDQLSLFVVAHFHQLDDSRGGLLDQSLSMTTAGFADNWHKALSDQPKRFEKLDVHTVDRFLRFSGNDKGDRLASITVRETSAYDLLYKSGIDATGVGVSVSWHRDAIGPITDFLMPYRREFLGGWVSECIIRFPIKQKFEFPEPSGGDNPYDRGDDGIDAREIVTFDVDWVEIGGRSEPLGSSVEWEGTPLLDLLTTSSALRLSLQY